MWWQSPKQIVTKAFTPSQGNYFRRYATEKSAASCWALWMSPGAPQPSRVPIVVLFFCFFYCLLFSPGTRIRIRLCHLDECMSDTLELALMRKKIVRISLYVMSVCASLVQSKTHEAPQRDLWDLMLPSTGQSVSIMMLILLTSSASLRQNLDIQPHSGSHANV